MVASYPVGLLRNVLGIWQQIEQSYLDDRREIASSTSASQGAAEVLGPASRFPVTPLL